MPPFVGLYTRMFIIGVAVAAPVGAMGVLCIQRTLAQGWRAGMATGLGIATADGIYAGLAAFGVAAVSAALVAWQTPLRLAGGVVLIYLGMRSMLAGRVACVSDRPSEARVGDAASYVSAVGLTLTNPLTIMAFAAVFASAGLIAQPSVASAVVATAGVASGSLFWWFALATGVALARSAAGPRAVSAVSRVSGAVIVGFGVLAIASTIWS